MQCNRILPQLNALADGELSRFRTWKIQRHLRHCTACTEELARIQQIGVQARQWRVVSAPPADLQARIVQALTKTSVGEAVLSHSTKEASTMQVSNSHALPVQPNVTGLSELAPAISPVHRLFRRTWRPVAALSLAGIALGFLALSLIPTHKTFAFAAVRQAMERMKTIHWVVQSNAFTQPGASLESQTAVVRMETWARLDKPALATLITPDGSGRTLIVGETMKTILDNKVFSEMPMPNLAGQDPEKGLRAYILSQVVSSFKEMPDGNDNSIKSEETVLNGQSVVRFYGGWSNATWKFALSLWVDPKTHLVVRSESTMTNPVAGQADLHVIADQFRYNEQPPAGIFDTPPASDASGRNDRNLRIAPVAPPKVALPQGIEPKVTAPKVEASPITTDKH